MFNVLPLDKSLDVIVFIIVDHKVDVTLKKIIELRAFPSESRIHYINKQLLQF